MTAEKLIEFASRQIRKQFDKVGRVFPMYHYVRADGQQALFTPPPFYKTKEQMVAHARSLFKEDNAVAFVFITEAWTLDQATSREDIEVTYQLYGSLENVPGRKEIVLLSAEDQNGMLQGQMEIIRPKNQKPYLGALEVFGREPGSGIEGRMVGLLPQRGTMQ